MLLKTKNGFTMIEMVFVIVVLGILAAVAVPRFAATRDDAHITKGRADVASIRSAIVSERQSRLIKGQTNYITNLDKDGKLFGAVLQYGLTSGTKSGQWSGGNPNYTYKISNTSVAFTYNSTNGTFKCTSNCSDGFSDFQ